MPAQTRRDLFLQVSGNVDPLTAAMKAGKSVLAEFGTVANDTAAEVNRALGKIGGADIQASAKVLEDNYKRAFANIRANAAKVLAAPSGEAAFDILSASAARDAVAAAESRAAGLRMVADAATTVANRMGDAGSAHRAYAVAAEANAVAAERTLVGLRAQAEVLGSVEQEMIKAGAVSREMASGTEAAAKAQADLQARADRLISSIDPLFAAQQRFNATMAEADALSTAGAIGLERYAQVAKDATSALDQARLADQRRLADAQTASAGQLNGFAGINPANKDAEASAEVFIAAADRMEARSRALLSSIDPLYAAQQRYDGTLAEGAELMAAGVLSAERYAEVQVAAAVALRQVADAAGIAAEKQQAVYLAQAAAARVEVGGDRFQGLIAETDRVRLANKSAADSFDVFRAAGVAEAQGATEVEGGHRRMGASGMIAEHVVRSLSDSIAAGQSPIRALSMEMGRITEATTMWAAQSSATEGKLGKLAAFMGGPWGLAISAGVALLGPLVAELLKGGDAAEEEAAKLRKNAESTRIAEIAKAAFGRTEAGIADDVRSLTKELDKQNEALRTNAERMNIRARTDLDNLQSKRVTLATQLADAERKIDGQQVAGSGTSGAAIASQAQADRVADLRQQLKQADADIAKSSVAYQRSRIDLAAEAAKREADPVAQVNHLYDERIRLVRAAAEEAVKEGRVVGAATERRLAAIDLERKAALKAEQEKKAATARTMRDDQQSGRKIDFTTAAGIVQGIGGRVTSAPSRSLEEQQRLYDRYMAYKDGSGPWAPLAAKPGTSMHGTGQAIDVAKSAGMTLAKIVEAFRAQGVHLTERLDEGDHFHVAWGSKGKAGPSAETLAKRQQSSDDKNTRNAEAYGQLLDRAQEDTLRLQRQKITDAVTGAALDTQSIQIERARLDSAAQAGVAERKWSQAQADALVAQYAINAQLKTEQIARAELSRQVQAMFVESQDARDARDSLLQIDAALADTRKQRLAAEQQQLADRQQSRYEGFERIAQDPNSSPEDFARAERGMAALPAQNAAEQRQLGRQYQNPLAGYRDELTKNVGDMGDALQGVAVDGIKGVQDGLMSILSGTKSVAQGFRDMAMSILSDLEKIAIEKGILMLFGLKDGGMAGTGSPLHFATGGHVVGPGGPREDRIPAMLSAGEFVVNAAATSRNRHLLEALNGGTLHAFADGGMVDPASIYMRALPSMDAIARPIGQPELHFHVNATNSILASDLIAQMHKIGTVAMIGGAAQAGQDAADRDRNTIR